MKKYRIKVTEKHTDHVWVTAENEEEALAAAPEHSECEYECLYDCEVMETEDINED